jgi:hypothetical protein
MYVRRFLICFFFVALPTAALADPGDAIGSAVAVVNQVTGEFRQDLRKLSTGDDVVQEEVIAAGSDSIAELMLRDQTKLAIGPGARLTLDRFIYDPSKTSGAIVLNLIKGGFRFITGVAAKPFYAIRTPVAAITVRGTIFDVYIEEQGPVWLLLHEGSIRVCNTRGECQSLDDPCRVLRIGPDGDLQDPGTWNALPQTREVSFAAAFPFVVNPPSIDAAPIFSRDDIEFGRCPEPKVQKANIPKVHKAENKDPPEPRAKKKPRKKYVYARPRRKTSPRYQPSSPGFSIGIGIGIGGGGRGGGGGGNH